MWTLAMFREGPWPDFLARLGDLGRTAQQGGLYLLAALVLVLLGWGLGTLVSRLVRALLRAARFNEGVQGLLGVRGTGRHEPAALAGWAANWLIITLAVFLALEMLGINLHATVGARLGEVLPRIITAAFLFMVGAFLAMLLGAVIRRFLDTAGVAGAKLKGQAASAVLTGFAILLALEQLGFAAQFVMILGIVIAGIAVLALALAFGLGCRDLARDFVVEYLRSLEEETPKRPT